MNLQPLQGPRPTYYACGICDHYHSALWNGDCRQDEARFFVDQLDAKHGPLGWDMITMDDVDDFQAVWSKFLHV